MTARIQWVDDLLREWAEWIQRNGQPPGSSPIARLMKIGTRVDGEISAPSVADSGQMWLVEKAVTQLQEPMRATVREYYLRNLPEAAIGRIVGCSGRMVRERVASAHWLISAWWAEHAK